MAGGGPVVVVAGRVDGAVAFRCDGRAADEVVTGATVVVAPVAAITGAGEERTDVDVAPTCAWTSPG